MSLIQFTPPETLFIIGIMSGTSLDGIDAVLIKVTGSGTTTQYQKIGFHTLPYPAELKTIIKRNSLPGGGNTEEICKLNFILPQLYTQAVQQLLKQTKLPPERIDAIGVHGQTIFHAPGADEQLLGFSARSTLQIGDPAVLAKLTNIPVVGNFRVGDIALGGQGAPLVPLIDYLLFTSSHFNRALLNIGGIANITFLPAGCTTNQVQAFDCGPGNILIDLTVHHWYNQMFDQGGRRAASGMFNRELFEQLQMADSFPELSPPKSTGREYYESVVFPVILKFSENYPKLNPENLLRTVTYYTAWCIYRQYEKFIRPQHSLDQLFISGGGAENRTLHEELKTMFGQSVSINNSDALGINTQEKEAVCFALLANEFLHNAPGNLPSVTGAVAPTKLGVLCLP